MPKALPWTPEQDMLLRKNHGVLSGKEIARLVGKRSLKACGARASLLGIRSMHDGLTANGVAVELGVSVGTVVRWIEIEFLEAKRRTTYEDGQKQSWDVLEESIVQFLQTHYLKYNPSLLAKRWKQYVPWKKRAKWISIKDACAKYSRKSQWFYNLVWKKELRAMRGWRIGAGAGETCYLYRADIVRIKRRRNGTESQRPLTELAGVPPYEKRAPRGRGALAFLRVQRQRQAECIHEWSIEVANGPVSKGICKKCQAKTEFFNSVEAFSWNSLHPKEAS